MKVTVFLNESQGSYSGFNKKTAELVEGFEFDNGREPVSAMFGRVASDEAIAYALDDIYMFLNVGGDIVSHNEWSKAYREQGHRSLSKGDVVFIDGYGWFAVGPVVGQEDMKSFAGFEEIAGGAHWVAKALERAEASGEAAEHRERKASHVAWLAMHNN